jgi:hypothetical protein
LRLSRRNRQEEIGCDAAAMYDALITRWRAHDEANEKVMKTVSLWSS